MFAKLHFIGFVFYQLPMLPLTWHLMKHTNTHTLLKFHTCMWLQQVVWVSPLGRSLFMGSRPQQPFDPPPTLEIVKGWKKTSMLKLKLFNLLNPGLNLGPMMSPQVNLIFPDLCPPLPPCIDFQHSHVSVCWTFPETEHVSHPAEDQQHTDMVERGVRPVG